MPEFAQRNAREQAAALYVAVLSQMQLKDWRAARALWSRLDALVQPSGDKAGIQQVQWLGAELELEDKQPQAALQLLGHADLRGDLPRPAMLLGSRALLALGQPAVVSDRLQTWVAVHPHDAAAWRLLAQAWYAQREDLRAIRAEAEARVAHYDYAGAVDRFKAAQDLAQRGQGDYIEASIIDTRLRAVQELLREQTRQK